MINSLRATLCMALIPPYFLDCVVAIGKKVPVIENGVVQMESGRPKLKFDPIASGFLYGDVTGEKNTEGKPLYRVYLVTNRHVVQGNSMLALRFNPKEARPAREYDVELQGPGGKTLWYTPPDPSADVAVVHINMDFLRSEGIRAEFIPGDLAAADMAKARDIGMSEGDGVFVLGFPMKLVGGERNFVIVRQGVIARISDTLAGATKDFLIDTFIFPGNSGGPVVLRPELTSIQGTKSADRSWIIGLVSGFQSYQEVAISEQTGRPRVVFEENSGLASVVTVDRIKQAIAEEIKATSK